MARVLPCDSLKKTNSAAVRALPRSFPHHSHVPITVILVAAYKSDLGDSLERASGWFDGPFDYSAMRRNTARGIVQFSSVDDPLVPIEEQDQVAALLYSTYRRLRNRNHFMDRQIPELLSAALALIAKEPDDAPPSSVVGHTRVSLGAQLTSLGLTSGVNVMVHSSLSAVGYTVGGVRSVANAIRDVIGIDG